MLATGRSNDVPSALGTPSTGRLHNVPSALGNLLQVDQTMSKCVREPSTGRSNDVQVR